MRYSLNYIKNNSKYNFTTIVINSLPLFIYNLNIVIPVAIAYYILGKYKSNYIIAFYGLSFSIFNCLWLQFNIGIPEIIGIKISKLIGSGNYKESLKVMTKYISIGIFLKLLNLILIFNLYNILTFFGLNNDFSYKVNLICISLIPCLFLSSFNRSLETFFISMNIMKIFGYTISFSYLIQGLVMYILIYKFDLLIISFGISKFCQELTILVINIFIFKKYSPIKYEFPSLEYIKKDFFKETWYSIKILGGILGEIIGFELNAIILSMTNNVVQISVWVGFINVAGFVYFGIYGIAYSIRTLVGQELGKNNPNLAKSLANYYFKNTLILIYVMGFILLVLCQNFWANIYVHDYMGKRDFKSILKLYFIILFNEIIVPIIGTFLRLLKLELYQVIPILFIYPILQIILGIFFVLVLKKGAIGCFLAFSISTLTVCFTMLYGYYFKSNWNIKCLDNKEDLKEKEEENQNEEINIELLKN